MYNKEKLLAAIWDNPDKCTGLHFDFTAGRWESRQRPDGTDGGRKDKTILKQRNTDGQIFFNYNGGSFASGDIWNLLQIIYGTNDMAEVFARTAECYGIEPEYSTPAERQRIQQRRTMTEIATAAAGIVTAALNTDEGAATRQYIAGRGLKPSVRMGAFSAAIQERLLKELKDEDVLNNLFCTWRKDGASGEWKNFADGYGLAMPYYNGSRVVGFCLRWTAAVPETYTDEKGKLQTMPKYLYSGTMPKGGYCQALNPAEPVYLVEGLLDAEAMRQAGIDNVMAIGETTPTDNTTDAAKGQVQTLQRYGAKYIVYVPDMERDAAGNLKTKATEGTINTLLPHLTGSIDGVGFRTLDIVCAELKDAKDAADVFKIYGADSLRQYVDEAVSWWEWKTRQNLQQNAGSSVDIAADFVTMYTGIKNPIERELIRRDLTNAPQDSPLQELKKAGVTADSLKQIERTGQATTYRDTMTAAIERLKDAVDNHATAEEIGRLLKQAEKVQSHTSRLTFSAQINCTAGMLGAQIAQEGDYIQTCWDLWRYNPYRSSYEQYRKISFAPAAITVFAAPTSHGKTLVMLQTALYLARTQHRQIIYAGLENDAKQLYIRALAAYIGKAWKDVNIKNPKQAIRSYYKQQPQGATLQDSAAIREVIQQGIAGYEREVMPWLHLVRVGNDAEALCTNIAAQVEEWKDSGQEVAAVFIDYMQLLHLTGRNYSRTDEMKAICDTINELAKTTGVAVIVGSQMNRTATKGSNGNTPPLDDIDLNNLGESSGIENIAEDCYFIWDIDRTNENPYKSGGAIKSRSSMAQRSKRIFAEETNNGSVVTSLRKEHIYIEDLKTREYATGNHCLIPADFAAGTLDTDNLTKHSQI